MQEVRITLDEQGRLQVGGNVADKLRLLGMLELAKALVLQPPQEQKPPLLVARGSLPNGNGR